MKSVTITTPSRLHFGLLGWGGEQCRLYGGVGLMVEDPGIELVATPSASADWESSGPSAARVLGIAQNVAAHLAEQCSLPIPPARITIRRSAPEHVGLGTGTQLSLATARALAALAGITGVSLPSLASWTARSARSGIGLHGHYLGGLIVDGGRTHHSKVPPLLVHLPIPSRWRILIVIPNGPSGLSGQDERIAFSQLPPPAQSFTDRLCRLILLGLLPAAAEEHLPAFGAAIEEIQREVGQAFAPAQRGQTLSSPAAVEIAAFLKAEGLHGVGQSSWGPALYGFTEANDGESLQLLEKLGSRFNLPSDRAFWTRPASRGARLSISD